MYDRNNEILLSVIVPIYNVQKYLKMCIESILPQIKNKAEMILVDDGSTDRCSEICDFYAARYDYIKVIHQKNAGLSAARNAGLDISSGKYIMFVDSDDFIIKNSVEKIIRELEHIDVDIFFADQYLLSEKKKN